MGSQIHSLRPQFLYRNPKNDHRHKNSVQHKLRIRTATCSLSYNNQGQEESISSTTVTPAQAQEPGAYSVQFKTLAACKLGIARYPDFEYNADGGAGFGAGIKIMDDELNAQAMSVDFELGTLYIPPLSSATTKFLGLPLPPFLKIDIVPELFRGKVYQESGKVDLEFTAKFFFSVGNIYRAPPLLVKTVLTSEESKGTTRRGRGDRLNEEGECRLVGVATVEPIDDFFMNTFLGLPTECLADLNAKITYSST